MAATDIEPVVTGLRPFARLEHPREVIRQFTPNWFAATMGTGILALALPQIPGIGPSRVLDRAKSHRRRNFVQIGARLHQVPHPAGRSVDHH